MNLSICEEYRADENHGQSSIFRSDGGHGAMLKSTNKCINLIATPCQQRTLTPPDTWSCLTLGLACILMSEPISPELVLSPDF